MDAALQRAYELIFSETPKPDLPEWQIAEAILNNFKVPVLGEDLARECIFRIVNHIDYPNQEITSRIVLRAESYATELWDDLSDEPHMADLAAKEYKRFNQK